MSKIHCYFDEDDQWCGDYDDDFCREGELNDPFDTDCDICICEDLD